MNKLVTTALVAIMTIGLAFEANAQHFSKKKQYWSVGGSINAMNYVGDVTADKNRFSVPFSFTRENLGVCALKRISPRMSGRGNFFWGHIKGNDRISSDPGQGEDAGRWERGANFKNTVYELSGTAIFDFYENRGTWKKRPDYTPYAFVGLGVIYHNPKMSAENGRSASWTSIAGMQHLGQFSKIQGVLLYGLGFRYKLDKRWDLALEIGWRKSTTDKLDGVWGDYEDTTGWDATELSLYDKTAVGTSLTKVNGKNWTSVSTPGEVRGKPALDGYIVTGLHLTRILGGGVICPKFR